MGINDRDYGRYGNGDQYGYNDQPGFHLGAPQSMTVKLIIVTCIAFLLQMIFRPSDANPQGFDFTSWFALYPEWFKQPWRVYELLTYGFMHSVVDLRHVLFNMLVLWFFGRAIEQHYGQREFLVLYLVAIVFSGTVWNISMLVQHGFDQPGLGIPAVGASGGLAAVVLLFALNYPHATILLFFVFPIKAWIAGMVWVGLDMWGALTRAEGDNIGYECHLGGFLFAFLYWKSGIRLTNYLPSELPSFKRKPPLKVHRPNDDERKADRLDELLGKVTKGGQESLSASERRELQKLSKYYQDKRRD